MSWISLECVLIAFFLLSFTHMHADNIFGEENFFHETKYDEIFGLKKKNKCVSVFFFQK